MKIGILREEKIPVDKRVIFTPLQCKKILKKYPGIDIIVQKSHVRCFSDHSYILAGIEVRDNLDDCDILLGIKEVPIKSLIPNKTYFFFSHTIKEQDYNRELLQNLINLNITMIDYEVLECKSGRRLLGFGKYAGIIGAYNGLLAYGLKSKGYKLKPANKCMNRAEMESELCKLDLASVKILVTGMGRVGSGIKELLNKAKIKQVNTNDFISKKFNEPVFVQLDSLDYHKRIDLKDSNLHDFYKNPNLYKSTFLTFAKHADLFIAGHFYDKRAPFLYTRKDAKSNDFNIKVVADISCDINGPVASTIRSSSIENPIYGYNPLNEKEDDYRSDQSIAVMAVDNLPCELPIDSSREFGNDFIQKILPLLIYGDKDDILKNATICRSKGLTSNYEYLKNFVNNR